MEIISRYPLEVPPAELAGHPLNDNRMTPGQRDALKHNIEANGGVTERLIVRELTPDSKYWAAGGPKYQILGGHQRFQVLEGMVKAIPIDVWSPVNDAHALRILATLNNVRGESDPQRRAALIHEMNAGFGGELEMDRYLPETESEIAAMLRMTASDTAQIEAALQAECAATTEPTTEEQKPTERNTDDKPAVEDSFEKLPWLVPKDVGESFKDMVHHWGNGMAGRNKGGRILEFLMAEGIATHGMDTPQELKPDG